MKYIKFDIKKTIKDIKEQYNLPVSIKKQIEEDNQIDIVFFTETFENLINEYIKINVNLNSNLRKSIDEEDFELANEIKEAIRMEEKEFQRLIILYHCRKGDKDLNEKIEAINLVNTITQEKYKL